MSLPVLPRSARRGILWPALPSRKDATTLSLLYQLDQSQWWSPEELLQAQLSQLEPLLAHAVRTVPYYREKLRSLAGIRRGGLSLEIFRKLPLLKRQDIQSAGSTLVSTKLPKGHSPATDVSTSGSTGRPITVKSTPVVGLFFEALNQRYHFWHGRDFNGRLALIRTLRDQYARSEETGKPQRWVPGFNTGPGYVFDITRPVGEQLTWLIEQKVQYLLTYATNLGSLLHESEETGQVPKGLKGVLSMSEVLDPEVREDCRRLWGVDVSDVYSAQEVGMIGIQCPDHPHYHVQSESLLVEVLRDDDQPSAPGEIGRVVVTTLNNFASPLIRYEIGDYAEVGEACSCGRGLPVLARILGRVRNMVTLPGGEKRYPRFRNLQLAGFPAMRQFQMIQHSTEEIEIKLVIDEPLSAEEEARLKERVVETLGHPFRLRISRVDHIPRSASGKFEDFMSLI